MAIETTEFASVSIVVSPTGVSSGNFGILGFLTKVSDDAINSILPAERARAYKGLPSVGVDWNVASQVYKAATAFYAQTPTPTDFTVITSYDVAQTATLVGGAHDTLAELQAITTGAATFTVDGTEVALTGVDLSAAADLEAVATIIQVAVAAVVAGSTCIYGAYGFILNGNTTGAGGSITFGTGALSDSLGFAQHLGKLSQGIDIETPVASLAASLTLGIDFIGLDHHPDWRDSVGLADGLNSLDIATWAEAAKKIYMHTSNSLSVLNPVLTTDTISIMKTATLRHTLSTFSKNIALFPGSGVFGRVASVNFSGIDTTMTMNLKQLPGITAEDLTPAEYTTLTNKFGSAVVKIGSEVNAYVNSRMASGSWLDTTHGLLWLENRIEVDMFNFLYQDPDKIPYTQTGLNMTEEVLERSLQAAVRNGLSAPGYLADGTYLPEGYRIKAVLLGDVASADKSGRIYKGLSFDMVGAGALHQVEVSGTFAE